MSPLVTLGVWIGEAREAGVADPDAMALATASEDGVPSVRVVLCRGIDDEGLSFYTNYESRKGHELAANPRAAVVFFWAPLERQVRVEGRIEKLAPEASDAYFHGRPRGSQIASAVSPQSQPVASLDDLRARAEELDARLAGGEVPRPAHWGGYRLVASSVELWKGGAYRLHDRVVYARGPGGWLGTRLGP